jgi:hypothetical protein
MSLLELWFIRNPVLVSYSICMRQGSSDLSGSQSALTCLCVCARARLGLREFNIVAGEACVTGDGGCCNLSLKIAAKSVRAFTVSSPTLAKGTSG